MRHSLLLILTLLLLSPFHANPIQAETLLLGEETATYTSAAGTRVRILEELELLSELSAGFAPSHFDRIDSWSDVADDFWGCSVTKDAYRMAGCCTNPNAFGCQEAATQFNEHGCQGSLCE